MQKKEIFGSKKLSREELSKIIGGNSAAPIGTCSSHKCEDDCSKYGGPSQDCVCHRNTGWCGPYVK